MSEIPQTALVARREQTRQTLQTTQLVLFEADKPGGAPVTALIKHSERGIVRSMRSTVPLSVSRGELYPMPVWKDGQKTVKFPLTAQAYYRMNQFGGATILTPDTVLDDDGNTRPNPFLKREGADIEYVRVRKVLVGRNPSGNLIATDYTLTYSLRGYLSQDMMAKFLPKGKDAEPKGWGVLMPKGVPFTQETGVWHPYDLPGGMVLYVNLRNKEVVGIIQEHLNRVRFAERNAITICERNLLKRFYAVSAVERDGGTAQVVGWAQPDKDFRAVAAQAVAAKEGRITIDGEEVEIERGGETVDNPEDVEAAIAGDPEETGEDADGPGGEPAAPGVDVAEGADTPAPVVAELDALRAKVRDLCARLGKLNPDAIPDVLTSVGLSSQAAVADLENADTMRQVVRELETEVLKATQAQNKARGEQGSLLPDNAPLPSTEPKPTHKRR